MGKQPSHILFNSDDSDIIAGIMERVAKHVGFNDDVDVVDKNIHITGYSCGSFADESKPDTLRLLFFDNYGTEKQEVVGALRLTRKQWEKLKAVGDRLFPYPTNGKSPV